MVRGKYGLDYSPTLGIAEIRLPEYGGSWKWPYREVDELNGAPPPFASIGGFFTNAEAGFVNLETPLCEDGRHVGAFCSSPSFAKDLITHNMRIVSVANNHAFDAGERGLLSTFEVLEEQGISYCGGGRNIGQARAGSIMTFGSLRIGFLAYTALCNSFFMSLVTTKQPGILPLYMPAVLDDISAIRKRCDYLVVAPHFDIEDTSNVHFSSIRIAHAMIDQGADLVAGSHGHVPKPVELYREKLIIYCLGNLIFPFVYASRSLNMIAHVNISGDGKLNRASFSAIDCRGGKCFSPTLLQNEEGDQRLAQIAAASARRFGTRLRLLNHRLEITNDS